MSTITETTTCFHCNDECVDETIEHDGHTFCCNGCSTVYQLLQDVGLDEAYTNGPLGIRPEESDSSELAYLDNDEVKENLLDFSDGKTGRISFELPAIHCSACVYLLERLEKLNPGVKQCEVNFAKKRANILFDQTAISLRELVVLLRSIGYSPNLNLSETSADELKPHTDKALLYRLGVAGFCFGNIMLLSFPEYLMGGKELEEKWSTLFNYLNLGLSLPLVLFAGRDYLVSAYKGLKVRHVNMDVPVSIGILAIFGRSAYDIIAGVGPGFLDSLAGFIFFLLIGKWYQAKTYSSLSFERDYRSFFPIAVNRVGADGQVDAIMIKHLLKGDRIQIHNDELIPCDCELLSPRASIDYSFVTGEAAPSSEECGNRIYAGGKNRGSVIELKVTKPVSSSYLTSLWNSSGSAKESETPPLVNFSNNIASWFSAAVLSIATVTAIYWFIVDPANWLNTTTAVLIIACPCALALSIPFTYGSMLRHYGRHGFFVRSVDAIAKLGQVGHVVFDKTGTITIRQKGSVLISGNTVTDEQLKALVNVTRQSLHPLSKTFAAAHQKIAREQVIDFIETPGIGVSGNVNGLRVDLRNPKQLSQSEQQEFNSWNPKNPGMGLTAIFIDGKLHARLDFVTSYREGLQGVLQRLKSAFRISLLSGDNNTEATALSNAQVAGFERGEMHFEMDPHQKREWISSQQADGTKVLMVGDGLNDAGALREAHFGISIAEDSSQFTPASDGILTASSFNKLPELIELSKSAKSVVIGAFVLSLFYNIVGIGIAVQGLLSPVMAAILMPLSSVSIVAFTTICTTILAKIKLK